MKAISNNPQTVILNNSHAYELYMADIKCYNQVDAAQERALALRAVAGDKDAVNELISANLAFVIMVAKQYQRSTVPFSELISAGNFGLTRAAHGFNPDMGVRFLSYAVKVIQTEIVNAIYQWEGLVHKSRSLFELSYKIERFVADFLDKNDYQPSESEIAKGLGVKLQAVKKAKAHSYTYVSLETSVGGEDAEDCTLEGAIADENASADGVMCDEELRKTIDEAMELHLSPREREVLNKYFGMDGEEPETLQEIASKMGLSIEGVRQIRKRSEGKLKSSQLINELKTDC